MIQYYRYLFVKKKVFNLSELHFSEVTSYKIRTLVAIFLLFDLVDQVDNGQNNKVYFCQEGIERTKAKRYLSSYCSNIYTVLLKLIHIFLVVV